MVVSENTPQMINNPRGKGLIRREAAQYLGVAPGTLDVWASTGRYNLPFCKVGGKAIYFTKDLDAFIESRMVTSFQIGG